MSTKDKKSLQDSRRNVGMQTVSDEKEYMTPTVAVTFNLETEEYPRFFAIPHNISVLLFICGLMYYMSKLPSASIDEGIKRGMIGCILSVLAFGSIYLPNSMMRRPHPIIWRFISSAAICWLLFVLFVLFQGTGTSRQFLAFFDKNLGKPLPEKSYAENCSLSQPEFPYINLDNFTGSLDFYLTAHLLGWYIKMMIIRDVKLCWFLSVLFEIMELTFRHWLPNFYECWWDHVILDVFGMNALGIWLGDLTCRYFEFKNYTWITRKSLDPNSQAQNQPFHKRMFRFVKLITPNYWVKHEWDLFSSTKRFYQVVWFFIFMNLVDLSHFFFKYVMWIPQTHEMLLYRILIWGLLANVSAREYYEYITKTTSKRFGLNAWLAHLILFVEWACIIKNSQGMFVAPFPLHVVYFWTFVFLFMSGITIRLVVKDVLKWMKKSKVEKDLDPTEPEIEIEYVDQKSNGNMN